MAAFGDYIYVHWNVGVPNGLAGTVTGEEYTARIAQMLAAGYGTEVPRPADWDGGRFIPDNPASGITRDEANERYGRIVISDTQPQAPIAGDAPILWIRDFGNDEYGLAVVTGD